MKTILMLSLFFSLSSLAFAQTGSQPQENTPAQELIGKSKQVLQLVKSKDAAALKSLLANDFQYVGDEGRLHHANELLEDLQDGSLRDFQIYNPEVVELGSSTALVTYNAILTMREGDEPGMAPRYQKISDLWIRHGDEWQLKFEQATPLRPID